MNRNNPNDIVAFRKRKKQKSNLINLIIFAIVTICVLLVVLNFRAIVAPLQGIAPRLFNTFTGTTMGEAGFPVKLPGSTGYAFDNFEDGFTIVTDTYVYMYAANGAQYDLWQHGYANPRMSVNDKRILVYDQNGRQFSLYSKNGRVYHNSTDDRIVYAEMGSGDMAAIVYRGTVYTNILEIFDGRGNWKYRHRFVDEHIMRVAFMNNDKDIIVAVIGFYGGDNTAAVYRFDTTTADEEDGVWKSVLPLNALPLAIHADEENVFVLCDTGLFSFEADSGKSKGVFSFVGNIIDHDLNSDFSALLINDFSAGITWLVLLDSSAQIIAQAQVPAGSSQVKISKDGVYVLEPYRIACYDTLLSDYEAFSLDEEFTKFINIGNDILLFGYDMVEKLDSL
ncbi:MAG: DUF5711 family protein [Oscillospiraceae bacterium]|nr:DUF5711 family protein [Oscillospiraceae bacterium]